MANRELVSVEELRDILNAELARRAAESDCRFGRPLRVTPGAGGCNWMAGILRGEREAPQACLAIAETIVREFGERYNLKV